MKKKGKNLIVGSYNDILKLVFDNEVTRSKEFKKFQEFKKTVKNYDELRKQPNPEAERIFNQFVQEAKEKGEYVDFSEIGKDYLRNVQEGQEENDKEKDLNDKTGNVEKNKNQMDVDEIRKLLKEENLMDKFLLDDSIDEKVKEEVKSMHSPNSDINNLIEALLPQRSKRRIVSKEIKFKSKKVENNSEGNEINMITPNKQLFEVNEEIDKSTKRSNKTIEQSLHSIKSKKVDSFSNQKQLHNPQGNLQKTDSISDIQLNKEQTRPIRKPNGTSNQVAREQTVKASPSKKTSKSLEPVQKKKDNQLVYPHAEIGVILSSLKNKKLQTIHQYDTIQLIAALKYIEFKEENINDIINMISYIRKKRNLKVYDFPEIEESLNFLLNNVKSIDDSYLVGLFYSTAMMKYDKQMIVMEFLNEITTRQSKFSVRLISNLVYALSTFQLNFPKVHNFDHYFRDLEVDISKKLVVSKKFKLLIDTQSLSNIVLAYCKTQNGSVEFYRVLEEFIEDNKDKFKSNEIANIVYSYSNNKDCNDRLLETFLPIIHSKIKRFQPLELCSILRAYHRRNMLNTELAVVIMDSFVDKHEHMKAIDLSHFYAILANHKSFGLNDQLEAKEEIKTNDNQLISPSPLIKNYTRFLKYCHLAIENLSFSFTGSDLAVIYEKIHYMQAKSPKTFEKIKEQTLKLMSKKDISPSDLNKVYTYTKGLKYEGKYDLFNEAIEQHLTKLKYIR